MEMIHSVQNTLIKETKKLQQKKYRDEKGCFLVEGVRLVEEGLASSCLTEVFYDDTLLETARGRELLHKIEQHNSQNPVRTLQCHLVSPQVIKALAETETPQGIAAIALKKTLTLDSLPPGGNLLLIVDGLQDPGNLGTMIRTAWAAGVQAVICLPQTVDPYNGKAVRSTMGGIFHIPIICGPDWPLVSRWCRSRRYQLVAGNLEGEKYSNVSFSGKAALVIGNEGQGLMSVGYGEVDLNVRIPLLGGAESLNAAVACGILLYEIIRQRGRRR